MNFAIGDLARFQIKKLTLSELVFSREVEVEGEPV